MAAFVRFAAACLAALMVSAAGEPPAPAPAPPAPAPTDPQAVLTEICAKVVCRLNTREIRLTAEDGGAFGVNTERYPYADGDGGVVVYAGEAFELALDRSDVSNPHFMRLVPHVDGKGLAGYAPVGPNDPPLTGPAILSLELRQSPGKADMVLIVRNDTGVALKFDAVMFVPTRDGVRKAPTSTCGIMPGMMGHETWPHPVVMLLLTNFRRVEIGEMNCE